MLSNSDDFVLVASVFDDLGIRLNNKLSFFRVLNLLALIFCAVFSVFFSFDADMFSQHTYSQVTLCIYLLRPDDV